MAVLKSFTTQPPGGWTYFQTETEFTIRGDNWDELIASVIAHRKYKNLHPQERVAVELDVQRQMCRKLGKHECRSEGPQDKWLPLPNERVLPTMEMVLSFSRAAISFAASGGELVPMPEMERRAEICRKCIFNQNLGGCNCNAFYKVIDATLPKERRPPGVGVCKVCSCSMAVKVNLTEAQVIASNEGRDLAWPEETPCWQKKIMEGVSKT